MPKRVEHRRVDLAHATDRLPVDQQPGAAGGVQAGDGLLDQARGSGRASALGQHVPHVDGGQGVLAGEHDAEVLALVGQLLAGRRPPEHLARSRTGARPVLRWEALYATAFSRPGRSDGAQHRLLGVERVGERDHLAGASPAALDVAGRQERQGHGLVDAEPDAAPGAARAGACWYGREPAGRARPAGSCGGCGCSRGGGRPPRSRRSR